MLVRSVDCLLGVGRESSNVYLALSLSSFSLARDQGVLSRYRRGGEEVRSLYFIVCVCV